MKTRNFVSLIIAALFCISPALYAEQESAEAHPYIGVLLDTTPLPELLTKHLSLSHAQGIRIRNVHRDSPADKAGLERDDIIFGFQGKDVDDYERFVDAVRQAGIGTEVSLQIIHLGQRKNVKLKLEPFKSDSDLKYPPEPTITQWWRPGKMFQIKPDAHDWLEIELEDFPRREIIRKFLKELYTYHYSDGGEDYTITIEGNPDNEDTKITVRIDETENKTIEYQTTVKEIDKLPKKYRESAERSLEKAQRTLKKKKQYKRYAVPSPLKPKEWKDLFERHIPYHGPAVPFKRDDIMSENIKKQMRELQQRIEQLEKHQKEMSDRLPDEPNKGKNPTKNNI